MSYTDSGFDKRVRNLLIGASANAPPSDPPAREDFSAAVIDLRFSPSDSLIVAPSTVDTLLVVVGLFAEDGARPNYNPENTAVSSAGLVWTQVVFTKQSAVPAYRGSIVVWLADSTGQSGPFNVLFTRPVTDAGYLISVIMPFAFSGFNASSPVGETLQSPHGPADGPWLLSFSATPAANSSLLSFIGGVIAGSGVVTSIPGGDWVGVSQLLSAGLVNWQSQAWSGPSNNNADWADVLGLASTDSYYQNPCSVAVEIKAVS